MADWWQRPTPGWLPPPSTDPRAAQQRYATRVGPFLEQYGGGLPRPVRELVERLRTRYASVLTGLDRAPATVVHGDLHLDNVLFTPGSGSAAG